MNGIESFRKGLGRKWLQTIWTAHTSKSLIHIHHTPRATAQHRTIIISLSIATHRPPPHPIKIGTDPHVKFRIGQAAKSLSLNSLRNSARGFFITGYCLGRGCDLRRCQGLCGFSGLFLPRTLLSPHLRKNLRLQICLIHLRPDAAQMDHPQVHDPLTPFQTPGHS